MICWVMSYRQPRVIQCRSLLASADEAARICCGWSDARRIDIVEGPRFSFLNRGTKPAH